MALLQPSFAAVPTDQLAATLKTLAVPDNGNLVVTGALPAVTGAPAANGAGQQQVGEGHPEASKTWFNRMYMRVSGATGSGTVATVWL